MNSKEKSKHLGVSLLAMVALAAASLWALACLASGRYGHPVSGNGFALTSEKNGSTREILRAGTESALRAAGDAFGRGRRAEALMALDAARRVARIGDDSDDAGFARLVDQINWTRKTIQNGGYGEAPMMLNEALVAFEATMTDTSRKNPGSPNGSMQKLCGATVVNAEGVRLGEIERVEGATTIIVVGNRRDLFGFVDAGGTRIHVPSDQLLWGKVKTLGATLVALPTVSVSADEIEKRFSPVTALGAASHRD